MKVPLGPWDNGAMKATTTEQLPPCHRVTVRSLRHGSSCGATVEMVDDGRAVYLQMDRGSQAWYCFTPQADGSWTDDQGHSYELTVQRAGGPRGPSSSPPTAP